MLKPVAANAATITALNANVQGAASHSLTAQGVTFYQSDGSGWWVVN